VLTKHYTPISETEYLRLEAQSPVRHEYVSGEIFAMTGGTLRHNVIAGNLYSALRARLRNTPCRTFMTDVRVRVARHSAFYYPDVLVNCSKPGSSDDMRSTTIEDPKLIVEVLSDSTASTDTREKLLAYRTLPSLVEYVLISQDEARVEIHRRSGDIGWEKIEYTGAELVHLASIDLKISMRDIYDGVPIESLERGPGES
jgi:Uma2 family endonuclease